MKPENLLKTADTLGTTVRWLVTGHEPASTPLVVREDSAPYAGDTARLAQQIQSLPPRDRAHVQWLLSRLRNPPPGTGS